MAILTGVRYLTVVLFCIFLIISNIEHLLMCLLAMSISSLETSHNKTEPCVLIITKVLEGTSHQSFTHSGYCSRARTVPEDLLLLSMCGALESSAGLIVTVQKRQASKRSQKEASSSQSLATSCL